jgi:Alpha-L-arabinofuranosidase
MSAANIRTARRFSTLLMVVAAASAGVAKYRVEIDPAEELGVISRELMGFNAIYSKEPDAQWQGGRGPVPKLLAEINTRVVRYPAGTVTTFYHWREPTVPGWMDSWAPDYDPAKNLPESATMSLDEYLDYAALHGITPLVGINLGSGKKYDRVADGLAEAEALVRHCVARGANVKYYYLDNEPYQPDANYTYSPEEYAEQINLYGPALRAIDPAIKLIANLHPSPKKTDYVRRVVELAGAQIDFVDLHFYWRHGNATFANWAAEPRMTHQRTRPYAEQRAFYRQLFADAGHPHIELAALEWNIGPTRQGTPPTQAEAALMVSEQFLQLVQSGTKLATFWPLHWAGANWSRSLLNADGETDFAPNKVYGMFRVVADLPGRTQLHVGVTGDAPPEWLTCVAARGADGEVAVYLLNKRADEPASTIEITIPELAKFAEIDAVAFDRSDESAGPLAVHDLAVERAEDSVRLTMPRYSFAKVILRRAPAR